jgi:hypothetical protein
METNPGCELSAICRGIDSQREGFSNMTAAVLKNGFFWGFQNKIEIKEKSKKQ